MLGYVNHLLHMKLASVSASTSLQISISLSVSLTFSSTVFEMKNKARLPLMISFASLAVGRMFYVAHFKVHRTLSRQKKQVTSSL